MLARDNVIAGQFVPIEVREGDYIIKISDTYDDTTWDRDSWFLGLNMNTMQLGFIPKSLELDDILVQVKSKSSEKYIESKNKHLKDKFYTDDGKIYWVMSSTSNPMNTIDTNLDLKIVGRRDDIKSKLKKDKLIHNVDKETSIYISEIYLNDYFKYVNLNTVYMAPYDWEFAPDLGNMKVFNEYRSKQYINTMYLRYNVFTSSGHIPMKTCISAMKTLLQQDYFREKSNQESNLEEYIDYLENDKYYYEIFNKSFLWSYRQIEKGDAVKVLYDSLIEGFVGEKSFFDSDKERKELFKVKLVNDITKNEFLKEFFNKDRNRFQNIFAKVDYIKWNFIYVKISSVNIWLPRTFLEYSHGITTNKSIAENFYYKNGELVEQEFTINQGLPVDILTRNINGKVLIRYYWPIVDPRREETHFTVVAWINLENVIKFLPRPSYEPALQVIKEAKRPPLTVSAHVIAPVDDDIISDNLSLDVKKKTGSFLSNKKIRNRENREHANAIVI